MYLDHNATAPMPSPVQRAVSDAMSVAWANPSSPHRLGQAAAALVQRCRQVVAERAHVHAKAVFFTSGATEANAWVLSRSHLPVVTASTEHPSVLDWATETVSVDSDGIVDLAELDLTLRKRPALVSVMAANNETGVMQPLDEIRAICDRHSAKFHCDATQTFGRIECPIPADFITVSAHKFGGPRGIGALISPEPPEAILRGGKQERGQRAGTLNVPGIAGFAAALEHDAQWDTGERDTLEAFCESVGGRIVGRNAARLPNTTSVVFGQPGDLLVAALDLHGVYASTGSACSSGSSQRSHVLDAMGIEGTPVRFSLGPESVAQPAIDALSAILEHMDAPCV